MSKLRIVCKAPQSQGNPQVQVAASWFDVSVFVVGDDGIEHAVDNVSAVSWKCEQGKEATAVLEFVDVEIDAEGSAEVSK